MTSVDARTKLVAAAERLFATHGIDGVSLRRIATAAGQRNVAATHYHFGDKRNLITVIFTRHLDRLGERREELRHAVGADRDLRRHAEVLVRPLAELAARPGSHYVRFCARLYDHVGRSFEALCAYGPPDGAVQMTTDVGHLLAERLPEPLVTQRLELALRLGVTGVADLEARFQETGPDEQRLAWLIDAITGVLSAPSTLDL